MGLTSAEVAQRVAAGQVNAVARRSSRPFVDILLANILTPFNAIIASLAALVLVFGSWIDALFGLLVIVNSAIGVVQELRAKRTLDSLALRGTEPVRVLRDDTEIAIAPDEVVIDDMVLLAAGEKTVVDGEIVASTKLEFDESLLTGETDPVLKNRGDQVLSSSFVIAGTGSYRATKVGAQSYAAKLEAEASMFSLANSELRTSINRLLKVLLWFIIPIGIGLSIQQLRTDSNFAGAVVGSVAGIVPMIPDGLVLLTSMAFVLGVIRLGRQQCLVQELPAVEVLARVDVLCLDKTGTLTEPGMDLVEVRELNASTAIARQVLAALVVADAHPNATLSAIGAGITEPTPDWAVVDAVPFSSARKWSGVNFGPHGSWVLGAAEMLLPDDDPQRLTANSLAGQGLRVLLLAEVAAMEPLRDVRPVALVVLAQRVRPQAAETLAYFADQEIATKVISGDNATSVGAVAQSLGMANAVDPVDARQLPDDIQVLARELEDHSVFGRVTPQQKQAFVRALQSRGHVVAMTGDGVNDVLALKDADMGVAMGSGSGAAKAVAKVVLLDNNFASLPKVLAEGRRVLANIERVANLFLTKTVYSIILAVAIGIAGLPFPFLPRHMTLVGSLTIGVPAFLLALAPNFPRAKSGFLPRVLRFAIPAGAVTAVVTFAAYALARANSASNLEQDRSTATLAVFLVSMFAMTLVARPLTFWKAALIAAMGGVFAVVAVIPASSDVVQLSYTNLHNNVVAVTLAILGCCGLYLFLSLDNWLRNHLTMPAAVASVRADGDLSQIAADRSHGPRRVRNARWLPTTTNLRCHAGLRSRCYCHRRLVAAGRLHCDGGKSAVWMACFLLRCWR